MLFCGIRQREGEKMFESSPSNHTVWTIAPVPTAVKGQGRRVHPHVGELLYKAQIVSAADETKRIPHPVPLRDTCIHQADLVATEPRLSVSSCFSPVSSVHHTSCYLFHPLFSRFTPLVLLLMIMAPQGQTLHCSPFSPPAPAYVYLFSVLICSCFPSRCLSALMEIRRLIVPVSCAEGRDGQINMVLIVFHPLLSTMAGTHSSLRCISWGARWLCQMSSPVASSIRPRGLNMPTYLKHSSRVSFLASTHQHQAWSGWVGHHLGNGLSGPTSHHLFISFLMFPQEILARYRAGIYRLNWGLCLWCSKNHLDFG